MSFNKNTVVRSSLTSMPLSLLVEPIPYAVVQGEGADRGYFVLCYAEINGEIWADRRDKQDDCDFDDHISCVKAKRNKGQTFAYDRMWVGNEIKPSKVQHKVLAPITEFFVVRTNDAPCRLVLLTSDRVEAEACKNDYEGGRWGKPCAIVVMSKDEVLALTRDGRFTAFSGDE